MKIFILRHLTTLDTEQGINGSQTDTPLSKQGVTQAKELVPFLARNTYDLFIVSPLVRTTQTIQPYLDTRENPQIIIEPLTIERDLGLFTNTRMGDGTITAHRKKQGTNKIEWKPPWGESIYDVYERAKLFLKKLKNIHAQSILICGHQNFLRCFEMLLLERPVEDFYSDTPSRLKTGEMREYSVKP